MKLMFTVAAGTALLMSVGVFAAQKLGEVQAKRPPEVIYAKTCAYCHGANIGPVIRGRGLSAETIKAMVRSGPNGMPAFRPTEITNSELDALAKWISVSKADPKEKGQ
jgi:mono/diheme cytochrome c family protein